MKSYFDQVFVDAMDVISEYSFESKERDDLFEEMEEKLWVDDSVTGNGSGSYTFNREEAKKNVLANSEEVVEALEELGYLEEAYNFQMYLSLDDEDREYLEMEEGMKEWEWIDVVTRCYFLPMAIDKILDNMAA